jgi:hypothetical protein
MVRVTFVLQLCYFHDVAVLLAYDLLQLAVLRRKGGGDACRRTWSCEEPVLLAADASTASPVAMNKM